MAKFDIRAKLNEASDKIKESASKPKQEKVAKEPKQEKVAKPAKAPKEAKPAKFENAKTASVPKMIKSKKFAKYSSGNFVNSELVKPRIQVPNVPYVNIEEELNALARANKIRIAISSSLGSIFTLVFLGYSMLSGSYGFVNFSTGNFVTYPAFANESQIKGGYVTTVGTKVYASMDAAAPSNFFTKIQTGYTGVSNAVIVKVLEVNDAAHIGVSNKQIYIYDNMAPRLIKGTYNGSIIGAYTLNHQYIAECISGSCNAGELLIVPADNIVGVVG
jgi:hypothetical protein